MDKIYHFIFGLSEDFNKKPFEYFHYLSIKSCYLTQQNPKIYMHYLYEPKDNQWWEKAKQFVELVKYHSLPDIVYYCNDKKVWRVEHQSDIFRLLVLKEHGGVYADIDTLFYKPFFPILDKDFVLGTEAIFHIDSNHWQINGLCNALIISKKDSKFLDLWFDAYLSDYDDYDWNKMSVRKPFELSKIYPDLIQVEPVESFHKYDWNLDFYHEDIEGGDAGIYSKHMAESKVHNVLKKISRQSLLSQNSLFSNMCKNIKGLLDE